jgi:hypothetical protein
LIHNQIYKPKAPKLEKLGGKAKVELVAEKRIIKENTDFTILDRKGNEVELEKFSAAPAEEEPTRVLGEVGQGMLNLEISPKKALEIFKSKIVNRPNDIERINRELLEVSEYNLVYVPIYRVTYKNAKTEETKNITIDGLTAKSY